MNKIKVKGCKVNVRTSLGGKLDFSHRNQIPRHHECNLDIDTFYCASYYPMAKIIRVSFWDKNELYGSVLGQGTKMNFSP